jgi:hypothetical protein
VDKWLTEFEQTATIFKFSELQKVLYAKRFLTGAAKMSLRTSEDLNTWTRLKTFLATAMREIGALDELKEEAIINFE